MYVCVYVCMYVCMCMYVCVCGFAKHSRTSRGVRGIDEIELQLIFEHMLVVVDPTSVAWTTLVREGNIDRQIHTSYIDTHTYTYIDRYIHTYIHRYTYIHR